MNKESKKNQYLSEFIIIINLINTIDIAFLLQTVQQD